jgi:serine/threonine protein kinase
VTAPDEQGDAATRAWPAEPPSSSAPTLPPEALAPTLRPPPTPRPSGPPQGNVTWMPSEEDLSSAPAHDDGPPPLGAGDIVGDFMIVDLLGEGGMGTVYRAGQLSLQRQVALKVLVAGEVGDGDATERFLREARSAAAVNHPHVVTTFAAGKDAKAMRLYIAMELMPGGDAERLAAKAGGRLPERRALEVIRDCARGLVAIEEAGLVHRDIKPENIFLTTSGAAKLGDLGLARRVSGDDRLTQTGFIVGTPCYMSPEQANGETDVDIRTDVYALAASLLRLLTGKRPFEGGSVPAILYRVTSEPPPDPREAAPATSPATCALIARAMAKDRSERHPGAAALLADLEAALAGRPVARAPQVQARTTSWPVVALVVAALLAVGLAVAALVLAR